MSSVGQLVEAFRSIGTPTVHEALGQRGQMAPTVVALWPGARVCGPAFAVQCAPDDNLMAHYAIAEAAAGDVLVLARSGDMAVGLWGWLMSRAAMVRGIQGVVTDGWVRDSAQIAAGRFPVFCRGTAIATSHKRVATRQGAPVSVGGQAVATGDLVIGDADGVVVVPIEQAAEVLEAALQRERLEGELLSSIESGMLTIDLLGLRGRVRDAEAIE